MQIVNPKVCFLEEGEKKGIYNIVGMDENDDRALIVTGDGVYEWFKNSIATVIRKVPKDRYPTIKESLQVDIAKLPVEMFYRTLEFLRQVHKEYSSEGCMVYFYNPNTKEYREFVPQQEVEGASVNYEIKPETYKEFREQGFLPIGTIHSHPTFKAFQSGTDSSDEIAFDGWHITMGMITTTPEYHCRWMFRGSSFDAKIEDLIDFPESQKISIPKEWVKQVNKKKYQYPAMGFHAGWHGRMGVHADHLRNRENQPGGRDFLQESWCDFNRLEPTDYGTISKEQTIFLFSREEDVLEEIGCTITT